MLHKNTMNSKITLIALIVMPLHIFGHESNRENDIVIKACGSALVDTVARVCDGVYNLNKRGGSQIDDLEPEYYYNHEMFIDSDSPYPFRSKRRAISMLKPFRSMKRDSTSSIVHECCVKSCTKDELLGYCG